jgi:hypothetical protein
MGNPNETKFDLEIAIRQWRNSLSASETLNASEIEELEGHLRESVTDLSSKGLTDRESFQLARLRLGSEDEIESEFSKARPSIKWLNRLKWMSLGVLGLQLANMIAHYSVGIGILTFIPNATLGDHPMLMLFAHSLVRVLLTILVIIFAARWITRKSTNRLEWISRQLANSPGKIAMWFILGMFCLPLIFGTFVFAHDASIAAIPEYFTEHFSVALNFAIQRDFLQCLALTGLAFWIHRRTRRPDLAAG